LYESQIGKLSHYKVSLQPKIKILSTNNSRLTQLQVDLKGDAPVDYFRIPSRLYMNQVD